MLCCSGVWNKKIYRKKLFTIFLSRAIIFCVKTKYFKVGDFMSIFEAGMMVCFGISWPIAAYKTYKSKCVHGKSIQFSYLILAGYICGLLHKLIYSLDLVIWLYIANMAFLITDMILYYRYRNNPAPVLQSNEK